jgi:hypothetical protein
MSRRRGSRKDAQKRDAEKRDAQNPNGDDFDDIPDPRDDPLAYFNWFEATYGSQKVVWPNLVGDCVERAECVVRFASPFYVVCEEYKKRTHHGPLDYDPLRVIFYLDKDGFVAITPKAG